MATLEQIQEIANRGIQDKLSPEKRAKFDELVRRGVVKLPGQQSAPSQQPSGLPGRLIEKMGEARQTIRDYSTGEITTPEAVTQLAWKGAVGPAVDVLGQAATAPFRIPFQDASPEAQQQIREVANNVADYISQSPVGSAMRYASGKWGEFKEESPRAAKNIESVAGLGAVLAPGPKVFGKAARKLEQKALLQHAAEKKKFVDKLILPKETYAERLKMVGQTKERGFLRSAVVKLDKKERAIANEVAKIPGIEKHSGIEKIVPGTWSYQSKYNKIDSANRNMNNALEKMVNKRRMPIDKTDVVKDMDNAVAKIVAEQPELVGDAGKMAKRYALKARQILDGHDATPSGILRARREFDRWVLTNKGQTVFEPKVENAMTHAVRAIRQSMNGSLEKYAPGAKRNLERQSNLFGAMYNVSTKAADQAKNSLGRGIESLMNLPKTRNKLVGILGTVGGVGIIGAAQTFGAPIAMSGLLASITWAGHKAIMSVKTKKAVSAVLKLMDEAISTGKNPGLLKTLRVDRAIIVEMLKNAEIKQEKDNGNQVQQ